MRSCACVFRCFVCVARVVVIRVVMSASAGALRVPLVVRLCALAVLAAVCCVTSVVGHYGGDYPLPPGAAATGFAIPRSTAQFDCAGILQTYWDDVYGKDPGGEKSGMLGVAIATDGHTTRAYWARSGTGDEPAHPPADVAGAAAGWNWVKENNNLAAARAAVGQFSAPRRCFGAPNGDWKTAGPQCTQAPLRKIERSFTPGPRKEAELGMPAGSCALAQLVTHLAAAHTILCAAELTPNAGGWAGWQSLASVGTSRRYDQGEIVSSCVTCQNIVPLMVAGGHCPLRDALDADVVVIANGKTGAECPKKLLDGDSCQITCDQGYETEGKATTCTGNTLVVQTCRSKCKLQTKWPDGSNPLYAGADACTADTRIAPGASCTFECKQGYTKSPDTITCNVQGKISAPQKCTSKCAALVAPKNAAVPKGVDPSVCKAEQVLAPGASCSFQCARGFELTDSKSLMQCSALGVVSGSQSCQSKCVVPAADKLANIDATFTGGPACKFGHRMAPNSACNLKCKDGYAPDSKTSTCDADGTITMQACVKVCTVDALPQHADPGFSGVSGSQRCKPGFPIAAGASCKFACKAPFTLSDNWSTCNDAGTQFTSQRCLGCVLPVLHPTVQTAQVACQAGKPLAINTACTYTCAPGYGPIPGVSLTVTCDGQGNLSAAPQCQSLCPVMAAPANVGAVAAVNPCGVGTRLPPGGSCAFTCAPNYVPSSPLTTCDAGGHLTPQTCTHWLSKKVSENKGKVVLAAATAVTACVGIGCAVLMGHEPTEPASDADRSVQAVAAVAGHQRLRHRISRDVLQPE